VVCPQAHGRRCGTKEASPSKGEGEEHGEGGQGLPPGRTRGVPLRDTSMEASCSAACRLAQGLENETLLHKGWGRDCTNPLVSLSQFVSSHHDCSFYECYCILPLLLCTLEHFLWVVLCFVTVTEKYRTLTFWSSTW